jgi:hypothetical protein
MVAGQEALDWLLVSGALLGNGIGFYMFFRILMNLSKRPK